MKEMKKILSGVSAAALVFGSMAAYVSYADPEESDPDNNNGDTSNSDGGDTSNSDGGDTSNSDGGDTSNSDGGDTSNSDGGDTSNSDGGDTSNSDGGDTSNSDGGNTSGSGNSGSGSGSSSGSGSGNTSTSKPEETKEVIEGKADVELGKETVIETKAGDLTVTTAKGDTALEGATFVAETVENAKKDLTSAVGKNASAETKALIDAANDAVKDGDAVVLDLSFEKAGKNVQPGKSVTLSIPVPETLKGKATLYVYHVDEDGIKLIATPRVSKGMITFTADKFSPFIISKVELNADAPAADDDTPATNPDTGIALAVAPVVLAAGAVVVASKKKH